MRKQCSNLAARYNCDIQKYPPYPSITIPFTKNATISGSNIDWGGFILKLALNWVKQHPNLYRSYWSYDLVD